MKTVLTPAEAQVPSQHSLCETCDYEIDGIALFYSTLSPTIYHSINTPSSSAFGVGTIGPYVSTPSTGSVSPQSYSYTQLQSLLLHES
jgi:hypothetical protein